MGLALMSILKFIFISALCICVSQTQASARPFGDNPNFEHLMVETGESVGPVLVIYQDKLGFIWIGGKDGLARYDGYRFLIYRNDPEDENSLSNNMVIDIHEDREGELWFATDGGGALRLNRKKNNFFVYRYQEGTEGSIASDIATEIYEDQEGNLWIGGNLGLSLYDRPNNQFVPYLQNTKVARHLIRNMEQISDREYLIATQGGGVFLWDKKTDRVEQFTTEVDNPNSIDHPIVNDVIKHSSGRIFVATNDGFSEFFYETKRFKRLSTEFFSSKFSKSVRQMIEDTQGILWFCSDGHGLVYYDLKNDVIANYTQEVDSESALRTPAVRSIFEDKDGDFWIGLFPNGVEHYDKVNTFFKSNQNFVKDDKGIFRNSVWAFMEDDKGNLVLGIQDADLTYFDREKNLFKNEYVFNDEVKKLGFKGSALTLLRDHLGYIWIGTWSGGLFRYQPEKDELKRYIHDISDPNSLGSNNAWQLLLDSQNTLWVATIDGGLARYNYESDNFKVYRSDIENVNAVNQNHIWTMYEDNDNRLWVGTGEGVGVLDRTSDTFKKYRHKSGIKNGLSHDWVYAILQDSNGIFWFGTGGGGLNRFDEKTGKFRHIRIAEGLQNDTVVGLLEDDQGYIWISTIDGLSRYNDKTGKLDTFTRSHWLHGDHFNIGAHKKLKTGELVFGGVDGFTIFDPQAVRWNDSIPDGYITEFEIFNKPVLPADKDSPIDEDILQEESIVLSPKDKHFSFVFTSLNYRVYKDNQYLYKLDGFDKEWRGPTKANRVSYSNLYAGSYTFKLKVSNNNGAWNLVSKEVDITVLPSIWNSWWAYTVYLLIILGAISLYMRQQRQKIFMQEKINVRLREIDSLKDKFLANTSHELRTPLNGIIGLSEALADGSRGRLPNAMASDLQLIISSGKRLAILINDILDFSKMKNSELNLFKKPVDMYVAAKVVAAHCYPLVKEKAINIVNNIPENLPCIYADENRIQQILHNLLGNAIKFTDSGDIVLSAKADERFVYISIADSGVGMKEEELSRIFESFEQAESSASFAQSGTGLGLAVSRQLVELHGGKISVNSKKGVGSTFTFSMPISFEASAKTASSLKQAFNVERAVRDFRPERKNVDFDDEVKLPKYVPENTRDYAGVILVVDDENVNRQVLRHFLMKEKYVVYEAVDGIQAIQAIHSGLDVDLILLDIMMPKMSGFETCKEIRKDKNIYELPIIFISAKTQDDDMELVFEVGGTDFLTKPVNRKELYARVGLHIQLSRKVKTE